MHTRKAMRPSEKRNIHKIPDKRRPKDDSYVASKKDKKNRLLPTNVLNHWQHLSTKQKIAIIVAMLIAAGFAIAVIYHLAPYIVASLDGDSSRLREGKKTAPF